MIIKKITVKRFRAIQETKNPIHFFSGLNIVKGSDNEAGKSSLRMAITKTLYQDPAAESKDLELLTSWGASEPWEVAIEFEAEGGFYSVTRSFKDKTWELICTGPHEFSARSKDTIIEKMAELTGCPTESFFVSTACIGQEEFIGIVPENVRNTPDNPVGTISKRLQAKLSGLEGAYIPELLARLDAQTHNKDTTGPCFYLQRISDQIADLRSQRLEQEIKTKDIMEKRRLLAQTRLEMEQMDHELPTKRDLLYNNRRVLELQKEIATEKSRYDIFQRAKGLKTEIDRLGKELEPMSYFSNAVEKIKKMEFIRNKTDYLVQQIATSKSEIERLEQQKPALAILAAGVVLIVGGLAGLLAIRLLWILSVVGFLLAAYWLVSNRAWEKQRKAAFQGLDKLEKELRNAQEEEEQILKEFQCGSYEEFKEHLADYGAKTAFKRDALKGLEALTDGKDWQKFIEENIDTDIRVSSDMKELQQLELFRLEPLRLQEVEGEVDDLQKRRDNLKQEAGALEKFFQYSGADRDQLMEIEERLTELEQERKFYERERRVYELIREILEQAYKQTLSRAADLMEAEVSRCIALITDGRYSKVKAIEKDNNLSIQTFSTEMNDWVNIGDLSRATQDQFYICARLALVKLITEGKKPVILLDDPFVNFHAKRLKKMMNILQDFAKGGYQILLFTCSDAYDYLGKVITIE